MFEVSIHIEPAIGCPGQLLDTLSFPVECCQEDRIAEEETLKNAEIQRGES